MNRDNKKMPELLLEQAALQERSLEEMDDHALQQIAQLKKSSRELLEAYPPERELPKIQRKVQAHYAAKRRAKMRTLAMAAPALAVLLVFLLPSPPPPPEIRTKGPPVLQIFRKRGEGEERLKTGARAHRGDVLQLRYDARGHPYGVILSIDGSGVITPHLPEHIRGSSARLERALVTLSAAYELDDAPNFERFFIVTAQEPFEVDEVTEALERLDRRADTQNGTLGLGRQFEQVSVLLMKETP